MKNNLSTALARSLIKDNFVNSIIVLMYEIICHFLNKMFLF